MPALSEPRKQSVLVIDDDDAIRRLVVRVLTRHGFAVEGAKDGGEGLLKIGAAGAPGYDLILLDLMMPNISGFDFIEYFKVHQPAMLDRIIILTASSKADHKKVPLERLRGLVEKPFDIEALASYVKQAIGNRQ